MRVGMKKGIIFFCFILSFVVGSHLFAIDTLHDKFLAKDSISSAAMEEILENVSYQKPAVAKEYELLLKSLEKSNLSSEDLEKLLDTLVYAAHVFEGSYREIPVKLPYIIHPMRVTRHLIQVGQVIDVEILQAAFLHDTVSMKLTSIKEIKKLFGELVAMYVDALTVDSTLSIKRRREEQLTKLPKIPEGAAVIELANKLDNLSSIAEQAPLEWGKANVQEYIAWSDYLIRRLPPVNFKLYGACQKLIVEHYIRSKSTMR